MAGFTDEELAQVARDCMTWARETPVIVTTEEEARAALQRWVDDPKVAARHLDAIRLLEAALAVDMSDPANRKGELPRALGLVRREDPETTVKHRAIVRMVFALREHSEVDSRTGAVIFPYPSQRLAADAIVKGFFAAGIDTHLAAENVELIFARTWARQR